MKDLDNIITIEDENGEAKDFEILLTFENEESNKKYVFYYDPEIDDEEDAEIFVSSYDDEGNLFPIEDGEEAEMVEEVFNTFVDENGGSELEVDEVEIIEESASEDEE